MGGVGRSIVRHRRIEPLGGSTHRCHGTQPSQHAGDGFDDRGKLAEPAPRCCLGVNNTEPEFRSSALFQEIYQGYCTPAAPAQRIHRGSPADCITAVRLTALAAVVSVPPPYAALPCRICRYCLPCRMCWGSRARNERRPAGHRRRGAAGATSATIAGFLRCPGRHCAGGSTPAGAGVHARRYAAKEAKDHAAAALANANAQHAEAPVTHSQ